MFALIGFVVVVGAVMGGYLMEHGEFTVELAKDERINEDLKVAVEVTDM